MIRMPLIENACFGAARGGHVGCTMAHGAPRKPPRGRDRLVQPGSLSTTRRPCRARSGNLDAEIETLKKQNLELLAKISARARLKHERAEREGGAEARRGEEVTPPTTSPRGDGAMDVVYVTAEVSPFSKTGGLADVSKSLPVALAKEAGHNVTVVSPLYGFVRDRYVLGEGVEHPSGVDEVGEGLGGCRLRCVFENVTLDMGRSGKQTIRLYGTRWRHVDWIFVDHPCFQSSSSSPYGDRNGEFIDNPFRFSLLSLAALELPLQWWSSLERRRDVRDDEILFVANDWHAAMVPVHLSRRFRRHGVLKNSRCLLCIHNLFHQGTIAPTDHAYGMLGLGDEHRQLLEHCLAPAAFTQPEAYVDAVLDEWDPMRPELGDSTSLGVEGEPCLSVLVAGIRSSDRIVTVSPTYAWEILSRQGFGFGFGLTGELLKRRDDLHGILNGIDGPEEGLCPSSDKLIPHMYSAADLSGKALCKESLLRELGFLEAGAAAEVPLIGFIGRLDKQKGAGVLLDALPRLFDRHQDARVVMLGTGDPSLEQRIQSAEGSFSDNLRGVVGFDVALSHRIFAGCDILLMPSTFEPCGLNQMVAMRYGTVPVVHRVGGLKETVEDYNQRSRTGTGWTFSPCTPDRLLETLSVALSVHARKEEWQALARRCMAEDHSWRQAASQYDALARWTMES